MQTDTYTHKEIMLKNIFNELTQFPENYLTNIFDIVYTFRINLPKTKQNNITSNFNWDEFISDLNQERKSNNSLMQERIDNLF